jgi:hypothetical protein
MRSGAFIDFSPAVTGVTSYYQFITDLREAFVLAPQFFNKDLVDMTYIREGNYVDNWDVVVQKLCETSPCHLEATQNEERHVTVRIEISADGVSFMKETAQTREMFPVVGRVAAIEVENSNRMFRVPKERSAESETPRFLLGRCPPFLIGYFFGKNKPPTQTVMKFTADELCEWSPYTDSSDDRKISIRLYRFSADGPARSDVKGSLFHGGYNALPRCLTVGERKYGRMCYDRTDCELRKDEDWESYMTSSQVRYLCS